MKEKIIQLYKEGVPAGQICRQLGVNRQIVTRTIYRHRAANFGAGIIPEAEEKNDDPIVLGEEKGLEAGEEEKPSEDAPIDPYEYWNNLKRKKADDDPQKS